MFNSSYCRLCLLHDSNYIPLFNNPCEENLVNKIMTVANVQITEGDNLPDSICETCLYNVESCHRFKILIEKSDSVLREQMNSDSGAETGKKVWEDPSRSNCKLQPVDFTSSAPHPEQSGAEKESDILLEFTTHLITNHSLERLGEDVEKSGELGSENKERCESYGEISRNENVEDEGNGDKLIIEEIGGIVQQPKQSLPRSLSCSHSPLSVQPPQLPQPLPSLPKKVRQSKKPTEKNVECPICHKKFLHSSYLPYHIKRHKGEKPFECHLCKARFTDKSNLKVHELGHLDVRPFSCDVCNKTFKKKKFLAVHKKIHLGVKPHQCQVCSKSFIHRNALLIHMKVHSTERAYVCKICNKSYKQREGLRAHVSLKHVPNEPIKCLECGKPYQSKASLETHRKILHNKEPPKYMCEFCGKSFVFNGHLTVHRLVHASKNEAVTCDICNKKCPQPRALMIHKKYVHSNVTHCCSTCGKTFKHSSTLKTHMVIHTGERPHICTYCGQSFTQKSAMTNHMKVHTGIEPYQCQRCKATFKWKQTFDKHINRCSNHRLYGVDG